MARDYDAEFAALMKSRGQTVSEDDFGIKAFEEAVKEEAAKPVTKPSEGFFIAKRQMHQALDHKFCEAQSLLTQLQKNGRYSDAAMVSLEIRFIEKFRDYVRNGMLWDTRKGP